MKFDNKVSKLALCDLLGTTGTVSGFLEAQDFVRIPEEITLLEEVGLRLTQKSLHESLEVEIRAEGKFSANCQRCLEQYEFFRKVLLAGMISDNQMEKQKNDSMLSYENGELDILKTVEDEFLLALPMVPKHETGNCEIKRPEGASPDLRKRHKPFSVLKDFFEVLPDKNPD